MLVWEFNQRMAGLRDKEKAEWGRLSHLGSWLFASMGSQVDPGRLNPYTEPPEPMSDEAVKADLKRKVNIYSKRHGDNR